jgi:WD repeat-containing protein 89
MAHPLKSTCLPSSSYVLSLVSHSDCIVASASSPSDAIYLLDKSDLHQITSIQSHSGGVTGIRSVPGLAGTSTNALVSCGMDGTVKVWDHRSNQVATKSENIS